MPEEPLDALTGLHSRAALIAELADLGTRGQRVTLMLADVDRVRLLNEVLTLRRTDTHLSRVARAMRRETQVRGYRLGADQFACLLPEADSAAAHAESLRRVVELDATRLRDKELWPALAALGREPDDRPAGTVTLALTTDLAGTALLHRALATLERAKRLGGNRCLSVAA